MERKLVKISVDELVPNDWNINHMPEAKLKQLADQMSESGPDRTPPIRVRKVDGKYQISNGEQRWRAAKILGWKYLWAEVVDIDEETAIYECLSFNILRGTVHPVKLYLLIQRRPAVLKKIEGINPELANYLASSMGKLTEKAIKVLDKYISEGVYVDCEMLAMVAALPPEYQFQAAVMAKQCPDPLLLNTYIEGYVLPTIPQEKLREEAKPQKEAEEREPTVPPFGEKTYVPPLFEEKEKAAQGHEETMAEKAEGVEKEKAETTLESLRKVYKLPEIASYFECECGRQYVIFYDERRRAVGAIAVKLEKGLQLLEEMGTFTKTLSLECQRCGLRGNVAVDAGEIEWLEPVSETQPIVCPHGTKGVFNYKKGSVQWST